MTRPGSAPVVAAAFAAQGFGYAAVVTALPALKDRFAFGDAFVSGLLLGVCVAAAVGSVLADLVAVRWGSRQALAGGLLVQAAALTVAATAGSLGLFMTATAVYGAGLGAVDAASNMQGVLAERRRGRPLLGRCYAAYTAAAAVGALTTAGVATTDLSGTTGMVVAAGLLAVVALVGVRLFDHARAAREPGSEGRGPLPGRGIRLVGALVLVAFAVDAAVSTWSTVYLDGLVADAALAPLGYAVYQGTVLTTRLVTDVLVRRSGRAPVALAGIVVGAVGCGLVAVVPGVPGAVAGFALAGVATGTLVPLAFGAAGELAPGRSDEVVARVNLFNYAGVVLGAASLGVVGEGRGLGIAFALPAVLLLAALPLVRRAFGGAVVVRARA
ncbi:MFS transporter [Nocardioides zeae]|uniref:MFS family permease n=1 Tax=Nocardioides zeae TaxID=1457234 RepID=A0AAJ1U824_9ACTN|nr:MFS transporter [Nocardioides zeae]MDQ1106151.1 MFS family permease [Nocardioides zeae]